MTTTISQQEDNVSSQLVMMSLARLARLAQEAQYLQSSTTAQGAPQVVCLRPASQPSRPPLVLIHPIGGSIVPYRDLTGELRPDRAIYAIQTQVGEARSTIRHATLDSVSEDYIGQLCHLGLGPRIVLGGYSLGGAVAFDMARRMLERGLNVDTLLIIDTPAKIRRLGPSNDQPVTTAQLLMFGQMLAGRMKKRLQIEAADLESLPAADRVQRLLERLRELKVIGNTPDNDVYHEIYEMVRHNEHLQRNFEPQQFAGNLSLIRTIEEAPEFRAEVDGVYDDPSFGWQQYCVQHIDVKRVPGSHFQLLYPPFIQKLAIAVQQILDEKSFGD